MTAPAGARESRCGARLRLRRPAAAAAAQLSLCRAGRHGFGCRAGAGVIRSAGNCGGRPPGTATGEGQRDLHGGARAGWAVQEDAAAERLDPVGEPDEAGAAGGVGAAAAVVADADVQQTLAGLRLDVDDGGLRVLGRVGQRLGDRREHRLRRRPTRDQRRNPPQRGLLVGDPLAQPDSRHDCHAAGDQSEGGAEPPQEAPLVDQGEAVVGVGAGTPRGPAPAPPTLCCWWRRSHAAHPRLSPSGPSARRPADSRSVPEQRSRCSWAALLRSGHQRHVGWSGRAAAPISGRRPGCEAGVVVVAGGVPQAGGELRLGRAGVVPRPAGRSRVVCHSCHAHGLCAGPEPVLQLGQGQHQFAVGQAVDAQPPGGRVQVGKGAVAAAGESLDRGQRLAGQRGGLRLGVERLLVVDDHVVPLAPPACSPPVEVIASVARAAARPRVRNRPGPGPRPADTGFPRMGGRAVVGHRRQPPSRLPPGEGS